MKDENIVDSKNSFLKTSLLIILGFCIVIIVARYITDENFRSEIDTNIFGKQVAESSLNSIEINTDTNPAIFAYDKYIAILSKNELWLLFIGIIFIIETLSVIIQVTSFKTTGKRVFKMSPIHHHFELSGWSEQKIVRTFWGITLIFCLLAIVIRLFMV